jgi:hypothetical protein
MEVKAPIEVVLSEAELDVVRRVARLRDEGAAGLEHTAGADPSTADYMGVYGAAGECAFCKGLGLHWSESVGTWKLPDVRWNIQVRTSPCKNDRPPEGFGRLIVRPDDDERDIYALVVGHIPNFVIVGWIAGFKAQRGEWWQAEAGRPPAWFVPAAALNPDFEEVLGL